MNCFLLSLGWHLAILGLDFVQVGRALSQPVWAVPCSSLTVTLSCYSCLHVVISWVFTWLLSNNKRNHVCVAGDTQWLPGQYLPRHRRTPHQWRGNRTDCGCNFDCDCAAVFGVLLLLLPVVDPQGMMAHTQRMVEDAHGGNHKWWMTHRELYVSQECCFWCCSQSAAQMLAVVEMKFLSNWIIEL